MKEKLNQYHILILIYMTQSGIMFFSLPRVLAEDFGTNGWIALFICSGIATAHIFLISLVYRWGDGRSVFELLEQSISRYFLIPAYMAFAAICVATASLVSKQYILMFQLLAFPTTNSMIFRALYDILLFALLVKGIYNISKASTVFYYFTFWMVFLTVYHLGEFEWVRLTPFIFQGGIHRFENWMELYLAFLGYEVSLFLFPYVARKTPFIRAVFWGNFLLTAVYLITAFICFGFFSFPQLSSLMYPLVDILAYIEFPFVERIENLLFIFFIFKILITSVMYSWIAVETLKRIFPKREHRTLSIYVVLFGFAFAFIPKILREVEVLLRIFGYLQMGAGFAITFLLLLILLIRKLLRKERSQGA